MVTFLTVIYILVALTMVLAILLQSGKGGGMGAMGGAASQTVFGGGGSADFMTKLTQFCAAAFMVLAMYLAYASSHSGSDFLQDNSEEDEMAKFQAKDGEEVNYEKFSPRSQTLPTPEEAAKLRAAALGQGETVLGAMATKPEAEPEAAPEAGAEAEAAPDPTGNEVDAEVAAALAGTAAEAAPTGETAPAPTGEPAAEAAVEAAPAPTAAPAG